MLTAGSTCLWCSHPSPPQDEEKRKASKLVGHKPGADVWGEAAEEQQLDQQKVLDALRRQEEVRRRCGGWWGLRDAAAGS